MRCVNWRLNYATKKITLTSHFIRYIYQNYIKISWNTKDQIYSKKLPSTSTTASTRLWKFPASLSDGLFVWIDKCCHYPCLQFIFGVARNSVGLSLNRAPNIIKRIAIWGVMWPQVSGEEAPEIFSRPRQGSVLCVARHSSSISHRLDPGSTNFSIHLM